MEQFCSLRILQLRTFGYLVLGTSKFALCIRGYKSGLLTLKLSSCIGWCDVARVSCVLVVCIHSGLFALVLALAFFMAWLCGMSLGLYPLAVCWPHPLWFPVVVLLVSSPLRVPGKYNQARTVTSTNSHHHQNNPVSSSTITHKNL